MSKKVLNPDQKEVFKALQNFITHPVINTFVLKGYAGTGKTFLMQYLGKWLEEKEQPFSFLASTGRAATVLRGKTGFDAKTVHGELYQFNKVDGVDDSHSVDSPIEQYGQMTLQFSLREPDVAKRVYIIDEASMLSSDVFENDSTAYFGSGMLLLDFFEAIGNNKIIFVGDPCQLPPVGQAYSPALEINWLKEHFREPIEMTLTKIERTQADNDILKLAFYIRDLSLQTAWETFPKMPARGMNNIKLYSDDSALFNAYLEKYKNTGVGGTLAIARTNYIVQRINAEFRQARYGDANVKVQVGDILLVVQNNYAVPLTNGDFIEVEEIAETQIHANLHFQKLKVKALSSEESFDLLVSLEVLYGDQVNLTKDQTKTLMVDFSKRMHRKKIGANSDKFKSEMMKDSYLNCLRAKYGYAVTCHKSQGGEWGDVFLFLEKGMYGMPRAELCRWWYTAITRAKETLHLTENWWIK